MNEKYQENFRLRISDFDTFDHLTPHAVLDLFQDVAGKHADLIGVGFDKMIKDNLIWVLLRTKYEVIKNPPLYSTVTVSTWPKEKGKIDFDREYVITDEKGEVLIEGISKWVVVNVATRHLSFTRNIQYTCDILDEENFPGTFRKIEDFSVEGFSVYEEKTTLSDLDHNGHVNNANYARFILNAINLQKNDEIADFEIDHIKELMPNSLIKIFYKRDGNVIMLKGFTEDGEVSFVSKITLR